MIKNYNYKLISTYRTQLMGIAILWIVLYHSTISIARVPILSKIKQIGYGGVDIFLILSGLGLYYAYQKNTNTLHFYKRRLLRIIPTYLPIVFVFCTFYLVVSKMSIVDLIMNLTTLSFWFNISNRFDWYVPAIMIFYLITPIYLFFFNRYNKYIMTMIISIATILFSVLISSSSIQYLLIFIVRIPIFFIGILMGYWISTNKKCTKLAYISYFIMLILGLGILGINLTHFKNYLWSYGLWWYPFILITIPLCMIITMFLQYIDERKLCKFTFLTFCGLHSLEIYLFHERVLHLATPLLNYMTFDKYKLIFNLICFLVALILASMWQKIVNYFINNFVENKNKKISQVETV